MYRIGTITQAPPTHEELVALHPQHVLRAVAANLVRHWFVHGASINDFDTLVGQSMSFSLVIAATPPRLSPNIWILDQFIVDETERAEVVATALETIATFYTFVGGAPQTVVGPQSVGVT